MTSSKAALRTLRYSIVSLPQTVSRRKETLGSLWNSLEVGSLLIPDPSSTAGSKLMEDSAIKRRG